MEIERKYLFDQLPPGKHPCKHLVQAYISRDPVIRIRSSEAEGGEANGEKKYVLTIKGSGLVYREEHELLLTKEQFLSLLPKAEGRIIRKTRYLIPLEEGLTAEADVFHEELEGLKLVEVEFPDEETMGGFTPPAWFGKDVSDTDQYHNSVLSKG